jgi:SAM-dependent methyltransferase
MTPPEGTDAIDAALQAEFREGFYPDRPAGWIEDVIDESDDVTADVAGHLKAIADGRRDFVYPGHDAAVFRILEKLVPERGLRRGADIGCATGCFPAMQVAAGIQSCTVFEVREAEANDERVQVRVQDLTYATDLEPEFDLITCLSTIEHIGLGRYGDPIDPWGDVKMAANLARLLRPGGVMLLSFPSGPGCVVWNKHRIYSPLRRASLINGLTEVARVRDRSLYGQLRHRAAVGLGKPGAFTQPIFVLTPGSG